MDGKTLTKLDRMLVAAALLLAIDLLALGSVDVSVGPVSLPSTGTASPDAFLGVLALLGALGIVGSVVLERFATVRLPALPAEARAEPVRAGGTRARAAIVALGLVVANFLLHPHPSYLGVGCWAALALGVVLVVAARRSRTQPSARTASGS